jgi:hypothetical protein
MLFRAYPFGPLSTVMIGKDFLNLKGVFILIHLNYANNKVIKRKEKSSLTRREAG